MAISLLYLTESTMSSEESSRHLFAGVNQASAYKKYRPNYKNSKIPGYILGFMQEEHTRPYKLAIDMGCGSGQSTHLLSGYFDNVIGVDCSETQIKEAQESSTSPNVTFRYGDEHSLDFITECSVDLVSCAQSIHWMDFDVLYKEVDRILKPGGCLAVYGYAVPVIHVKDGQSMLEKQLQPFGTEIYHWVRPYGSGRLDILDAEYADVSLPYGNQRRYTDVFYEDVTVNSYIGLIQSWSPYNQLIKQQPEKASVLQDYKKRFLEAISHVSQNPSEYEMQLSRNCFLLMSRKPLMKK